MSSVFFFLFCFILFRIALILQKISIQWKLWFLFHNFKLFIYVCVCVVEWNWKLLVCFLFFCVLAIFWFQYLFWKCWIFSSYFSKDKTCKNWIWIHKFIRDSFVRYKQKKIYSNGWNEIGKQNKFPDAKMLCSINTTQSSLWRNWTVIFCYCTIDFLVFSRNHSLHILFIWRLVDLFWMEKNIHHKPTNNIGKKIFFSFYFGTNSFWNKWKTKQKKTNSKWKKINHPNMIAMSVNKYKHPHEEKKKLIKIFHVPITTG